MTEPQYDYTLNQILHAALSAQGYTVREQGGKLLPDTKIPISLDTLAHITDRRPGKTVTRLDVEIGLPDGRLLYQTFGDMGDSVEEALSANWENFHTSTLNVLLEALGPNGKAQEWELGGIPFHAYPGSPTLKFAGTKPQLPDIPLIAAIHEALNRSRPDNRIHFAHFFISQIGNGIDTVEITLDNTPLPQAEQALRRLPWPLREHFYSCRLFAVLIPRPA
ncbi:MAG: DUF6348 family protein [Neisseria sp.]|nr:DUF6348 family protein [Neisseria sp.]